MAWKKEINLWGVNSILFYERFPDDNACYRYIADIKWTSGFVCKKYHPATMLPPPCLNRYFFQGWRQHGIVLIWENNVRFLDNGSV